MLKFHKVYFIILLLCSLCLSSALAKLLTFDNCNIVFKNNHFNFNSEFRKDSQSRLESVNFYFRRSDNDLYIGASNVIEAVKNIIASSPGRLSFDFSVPYLPAGEYTLVVKSTFKVEPENHVLKSSSGRSIIRLNGYDGKNYEYKCKVTGSVIPFIRGQEGIEQSSHSWRFYYSAWNYNPASISLLLFNDKKWNDISKPKVAEGLTEKRWHKFFMRAEGEKIECKLDDISIAGEDIAKTFMQGYLGFRSGDRGKSAYIDDIEVKDLDTGKIIFQDDFESGTLYKRWEILSGKWHIAKGVPESEEAELGAFKVTQSEQGKLPKVDVKKRKDGINLFINGNQVVPLFFCHHLRNYYQENTYDVARRVYESGIQLFVPVAYNYSFNTNGHIDYSRLDDAMAQFLMACPNAYFILRNKIPSPLDLPLAEKVKVGNGTEAGITTDASDAKTLRGGDASLASSHYRDFATQEMTRFINHIQNESYGTHMLGSLLLGAGYEGNWGHCGEYPDYYLDVCPAQVKRFSNFLQNKYGNKEALRNAWGKDDVDFINPPFPDWVARSASDIAGFRNPADIKNRWVTDFFEMYLKEGTDIIEPIFDIIKSNAPNSFFGIFGYNTLDSTGGPGVTTARGMPAFINHPAVKFMAGILTYGDRNAGGVSANGVTPWESARIRGKMMMQEVDMRTPAYSGKWSESSYEDASQSMRREFVNVVLMERMAMWYYDMGSSGPWFDNPVLLKEMKKEIEIGNAALTLTRKSVAETMVVVDMYPWRFFSNALKQLQEGEKVKWSSVKYAYNYVSLTIEAIMRMGTPRDSIFREDLQKNMNRKLYIFPYQFYIDKQLMTQINQLTDNGAVSVFMGPAGLINEKSADLNNMQKLFGMKISLGAPAPISANVVTGEHLLLRGFKGNERIGGGGQRWHNRDVPSWHRFYIEESPDLEVLARYSDGKIAAAMKKQGKGAIIYSGVPITLPKMYRNIAKFAGAHIYTDADDAIYADNNFLMIHTDKGGERKISLPVKATEVLEVFSGKIAGRNTKNFNITMPDKSTAVYYIGNDRNFLNKIRNLK